MHCGQCCPHHLHLPFSLPPLSSPPLPQAGQLSSVEEVTEKVALAKALEPDHYALYMVLGDAVSGMYSPHITPSAPPTDTSHLHITRTPLTRSLPSLSERFLHPSEGILQVIQDCRTDHYLCIKPNTLHLVLRDHVSSPSGVMCECVMYVRMYVHTSVCVCVCVSMDAHDLCIYFTVLYMLILPIRVLCTLLLNIVRRTYFAI